MTACLLATNTWCTFRVGNSLLGLCTKLSSVLWPVGTGGTAKWRMFSVLAISRDQPTLAGASRLSMPRRAAMHAPSHWRGHRHPTRRSVVWLLVAVLCQAPFLGQHILFSAKEALPCTSLPSFDLVLAIFVVTIIDSRIGRLTLPSCAHPVKRRKGRHQANMVSAARIALAPDCSPYSQAILFRFHSLLSPLLFYLTVCLLFSLSLFLPLLLFLLLSTVVWLVYSVAISDASLSLPLSNWGALFDCFYSLWEFRVLAFYACFCSFIRSQQRLL